MTSSPSAIYSKRLTCFVDILGFGALVDESNEIPAIQASIREALASIEPTRMRKTDMIRINESIVPPEELAEVRKVAEMMAEAIHNESPVAVSFFSDCLVLSAPAGEPLGCQMILHLLCALSVRMWIDHRLTIRGGISIGNLYHVEGAQMFGPAMNAAYLLESKHAVYPRVILDKQSRNHLWSQPTFSPMSTILQEGNDFCYISLATCYRHILTSSTWALGADGYRDQCLAQMKTMPEAIREILGRKTDAKIVAKYEWLLQDAEARLGEI